MPTAFDFRLPTAAKIVPDGPDWLHEIKYDGYRLRVERQARYIRLLTKNGHNWTKRYPWIVEAALKNREQRFVIDGESVVLDVDGVSDFNALHSRKHDAEAIATNGSRSVVDLSLEFNSSVSRPMDLGQ